jgi:hypothetical protein
MKKCEQAVAQEKSKANKGKSKRSVGSEPDVQVEIKLNF